MDGAPGEQTDLTLVELGARDNSEAPFLRGALSADQARKVEQAAGLQAALSAATLPHSS